jgi:acyl-coenzyme A synthetase/AMP-(fatty) acid ligase
MPPEDEIKGTGIATFVTLKQGKHSSLGLVDELK